MPLPITAVFDGLPDPRRETANKRHHLTDILTIATCAVIGGADSWDAIAAYGEAKEAFFERFLPLANGIPRPNMFARAFAKLRPDAFADGRMAVTAWAATNSSAATGASRTACTGYSMWCSGGRPPGAGEARVANPAMLRRVAVSLPRRAPGKGTMPTTKRLMAGWDDGFLLQVLQGITADVVR